MRGSDVTTEAMFSYADLDKRIPKAHPLQGILKEYVAGAKMDKICRRHNMLSATLYKWKAKYADMQVR